MKTSLKIRRHADALMLKRDAVVYGKEKFPAESFLLTAKEAIMVIMELQRLIQEVSSTEAHR